MGMKDFSYLPPPLKNRRSPSPYICYSGGGVGGGRFLEVAHFTRFLSLWWKVLYDLACSTSVMQYIWFIDCYYVHTVSWAMQMPYDFRILYSGFSGLFGSTSTTFCPFYCFLLSLGWVGVWWWCLFMAYSIWYHCMLFNGHGYHNLLFIWSVNGHQVKWYGANNYPLLQKKN